MSVQDALGDVKLAFRQFEFAIKLLSYCEQKKIDPSDLDIDHVIELGQEMLILHSGKFNTQDSMEKTAGTSVLIAFSATILALDHAFEAAGVTKDPNATSNEGQLRLLIFMMRCAHAHGIAEPIWKATGKYRRILDVIVEGVQINLDLKSLHETACEVEQIGGYANWYRILRTVQHLLAPPP